MSVEHITGTWKFTKGQFFQLVLRIAVGFLLLLKGFYFIRNIGELHTMVMESNTPLSADFLVTYITWAHMLGGALIMLGLLTRVFVILQIPIIIGALFYNFAPDTFGAGGEMVLSIVVLLLLIYFLINGSGKLSMDYFKKNHKL